MAGELFLSQWQAAKENAGYGVPVPVGTRKLYVESGGSNFGATTAPQDHHFATGRPDNVLAVTLGAQTVAGTVTCPVSSSELLEFFNIGIGTPVITTPATGVLTRLHTYKPGATLPESGTFQWMDAANAFQVAGVYANTLGIQGSAGGNNQFTAGLFGKGVVPLTLNPAAGVLADRNPDFFQGWETKLYINDIGTTPGVTVVPNTLINWQWSLSRQLGRRFTADNVNAMNKAIQGEIMQTCTLTFSAEQAISLTELNHWLNNDTAGRMVRLELGQNTLIEGPTILLKSFITLDIPGVWTAVALGSSDSGARIYGLSLSYKYDSVLGAGAQIRVQNGRAAAWS
jgi:hypothetical protein